MAFFENPSQTYIINPNANITAHNTYYNNTYNNYFDQELNTTSNVSFNNITSTLICLSADCKNSWPLDTDTHTGSNTSLLINDSTHIWTNWTIFNNTARNACISLNSSWNYTIDTDTFVTQDNITGWGFYNAESNLTDLLDNNYLANSSSATFSKVTGTSVCVGALCITNWDEVNKTFVDTFVTADNVTGWGFYNTETNLTDLLNDDYLVNDSGARLSVLNVSGDVSLAGTLYTDKANTRIGIGVESPNHALHLQSNSSTSLGFETVADSAAPAIVCKRAKGNTSDKQAGTPGIWMCSLSFQVWDGNSYGTAAQIVGRVGAGVSDGDVPGDLLFYTTPDGASTGEIRMVILDSGFVGINNTNPSVMLEVNGDIIADSYSDHSKMFVGDAIESIKGIQYLPGSLSGDWADVNHSTLPIGVRKVVNTTAWKNTKTNEIIREEPVDENMTLIKDWEEIKGEMLVRDLGNTAQLNMMAIKQLTERIEELEIKVAELEKEIK